MIRRGKRKLAQQFTKRIHSKKKWCSVCTKKEEETTTAVFRRANVTCRNEWVPGDLPACAESKSNRIVNRKMRSTLNLFKPKRLLSKLSNGFQF